MTINYLARRRPTKTRIRRETVIFGQSTPRTRRPEKRKRKTARLAQREERVRFECNIGVNNMRDTDSQGAEKRIAGRERNQRETFPNYNVRATTPCPLAYDNTSWAIFGKHLSSSTLTGVFFVPIHNFGVGSSARRSERERYWRVNWIVWIVVAYSVPVTKPPNQG